MYPKIIKVLGMPAVPSGRYGYVRWFGPTAGI